MNPQQAAERLAHLDLETGVVAEVGEFGSWLTIEVNDWVHLLEKSVPRTPKVGQIATLYRLQGGDIQGIDLDGEPLFFWSKADIEAERQQDLKCIVAEKVERKIKFFEEFDNPQSDFNRRLHRLPKVFQQRFKKFFRLGVDFWDLAWDELVACESALKIAYTCKSWQGIHRFYNMTVDEQKAHIPSLDHEMSGYMFNFACRAAKVYLRNPKLIRKIRGALSPLTGTWRYTGR